MLAKELADIRYGNLSFAPKGAARFEDSVCNLLRHLVGERAVRAASSRWTVESSSRQSDIQYGMWESMEVDAVEAVFHEVGA